MLQYFFSAKNRIQEFCYHAVYETSPDNEYFIAEKNDGILSEMSKDKFFSNYLIT